MAEVIARATPALALLIACGGPAARVSLVPVGDGTCGRPDGATGLKVTAYGAGVDDVRAVALDDGQVTIGDFPEGTQQLGVEVLVANGDVGAAGKTAPLDFANLPDGTVLPIFMAPVGGFCPVGAMQEARSAPLVARAGAGVLVAGGIGASGPLVTAELYDPATATFSHVDVPPLDPDDLIGAVLTTMPDGKVALTGGARGILTVFDPEKKSFGSVFTISPQRAFHAAIAIDATHVLVAGGCAGVDASLGCQLPALHSTFIYDLTGNQVGGPNLSPMVSHEGAQLFDTGVQLDGSHALVLAGGFGDPGAGERFAVGDDAAVALAGFDAQVVPLDGGALLSAFVDDATMPPDAGPVAALPPDGSAVVAMQFGPKLTGTRLVLLEDGSVVGIGGDLTVAHYLPTGDQWKLETPPGDGPGAIVAPAVIRLDDGAVLVLGGDTPSAAAWEYRPSLVGPSIGSVTTQPQMETSDTLTVPDPRAVDRAMDWTLTATDDTLNARALVGGPRTSRGSVLANMHDVTGGFALIAEQTAPGEAIAAVLRDGEAARLVRVTAGVESTLCTGSMVTLASGPISATLTIDDQGASVAIADLGVLACDFAGETVGAWGVSASGAGAHVAVDAVRAAR
jgi:large repetitive protein